MLAGALAGLLIVPGSVFISVHGREYTTVPQPCPCYDIGQSRQPQP